MTNSIFTFLGKLIEAFMAKFYPLEPETTETPMPKPVEATGTLLEAPKLPHSERFTPEPIKTTLEVFATALRDFEGKPGDLNYRNNNPGNFRCSPVGYLAKYGNVQCKNGFAVFPTYELGWEYLLASVKYRAQKHPTWTILDFFSNYAPTSDGNEPKKYAAYVARRCGVSVSTVMKDLFA